MIDVTDLLANADQDQANALFSAFQSATGGCTVATVWWGFAMIQAHLLSSAPDDCRLDVAAKLADMCAVALPAAMMAQDQG